MPSAKAAFTLTTPIIMRYPRLQYSFRRAASPRISRAWKISTLVLAASLCLFADHAGHAYKLGVKAERHKQYDLAYAYFRQALDLKPNKIPYLLAFQRCRFEAALEHVRRGDALRLAHHNRQALEQYRLATAMDPSNFIAANDYQQLRRQLNPAAAQPVTPERQDSIARRLALAAGPEELGATSNTPITLRLDADSRIAYRTVGRLANLNVLFDRNYQPAPITLNVHQVSVLEALRILGIESHSFYTVVTPNTIYVASDNMANRQRLQQLVVKTFYLHNLTSPTDVNQVAQTVRTLLNAQRVQALPSQMALIMRDTPDRVAVAQQVIDSLDQQPPEVLVDVRVLEVSRDLVRDLGLQPPTSLTVGLQSTTPASSSSSSSSSSTTTSTPLNFNNLRHLAGRNYSFTIGTATLNLLLSDSRTHTLQEPQLRAIQGIEAKEKIGERIPVATGSFQPGIGGVGINPLVNTQFSYQSVGVNISIQPFVHPDNQVTLKNKIEISSVISNTTIGGITEPIIGQRIYDSTIELQSGQSSVLSGILTENNIKNLSGIPGLSQVPLLKYLFSNTHIEHLHDEILIVMTPHILHPFRISPEASRVIDTGTQNDITLHELPPAVIAPTTHVMVPLPGRNPAPAPQNSTPPPAATPQPPAAHVVSPPTHPAQPPATPPANLSAPSQPAAPAPSTAPHPAASAAMLGLEPQRIHTLAGSEFRVRVALHQAPPLFSLSFELAYDPRLVSVAQVLSGPYFRRDGRPLALSHQQDADLGRAFVSLSRPDGAGGLAGSGSAVEFLFHATAAGLARLTLSHVIARNPQGAPVPLHLSPSALVVSR